MNTARDLKSCASEFQIQKAFVEYLRYLKFPGLCWFHVPNQAVGGPARGAHLKAMGRRPGVPDMILLYQGMAIGLEFKSAHGTASPSQVEFMTEWIHAGGEYVIAHSVND